VRSLSILILLIMPQVVFADCILTDFPYKYGVVCSGYNPMSPPADSKKKTKIAKKSGKTKKVYIGDIESAGQAVVMSEEELQYMLARNRMDGYRGKQKPRELTAKN